MFHVKHSIFSSDKQKVSRGTLKKWQKGAFLGYFELFLSVFFIKNKFKIKNLPNKNKLLVDFIIFIVLSSLLYAQARLK